jgi:integrase
LERFGSLDLSSQNLVKFYKFLKDKGLKNNTIEQVLRDAWKFILWVQKHYPDWNAFFDKETFEEIKLAKRKRLKQKEEETFTEDQLREVFEATKDYGIFYYFTLLLAFSGLRLSEALALHTSDFKGISDHLWEMRISLLSLENLPVPPFGRFGIPTVGRKIPTLAEFKICLNVRKNKNRKGL